MIRALKLLNYLIFPCCNDIRNGMMPIKSLRLNMMVFACWKKTLTLPGWIGRGYGKNRLEINQETVLKSSES